MLIQLKSVIFLCAAFKNLSVNVAFHVDMRVIQC